MEKLWTSTEVAEYLGVDEPAVERLILEGRITGYKVGGQFLRFRPSEVEALKGKVIFQQTPRQPHPSRGRSAAEGVADFFYFNDFYLVAAALMAGLVVYLIAV